MPRIYLAVTVVAALTFLSPGAGHAQHGAPGAVVTVAAASDGTARLPVAARTALAPALKRALRRHAPDLPQRTPAAARGAAQLRVTPRVRELRAVRAARGLELRCAVAVQIERLAPNGAATLLAEAVGRGLIIGGHNVAELAGAGEQCVRAAVESVAAERLAPYLERAARRTR